VQRKALVVGLAIAGVVLALVVLPALLAFPAGSTLALLTTQATRTPLPTFTPRRPAEASPAPPTVAPEQHAPITPTTRGGAVMASPTDINGVPIDQIIVLTEATRRNVQQIFARGLALGRNPRAFAKVGDSTMVWPPFLATFADPQAYQLGAYIDLQPTIVYFAGSFARDSVAVKIGMHTWTEFDATWARQGVCRSSEGPLACELRVQNPSVAIIRLGANDALDAPGFETNMRRVVEYCIANGVIPVLGSKPDRVEGPDNTINKIIYRLAASYNVPLWDYDLIAATVPGKGLQADGIHFLADGPHDYTAAAAFRHADSLEDLSALILLDMIRGELQTRQ
jgi:hypothetical protein